MWKWNSIFSLLNYNFYIWEYSCTSCKHFYCKNKPSLWITSPLYLQMSKSGNVLPTFPDFSSLLNGISDIDTYMSTCWPNTFRNSSIQSLNSNIIVDRVTRLKSNSNIYTIRNYDNYIHNDTGMHVHVLHSSSPQISRATCRLTKLNILTRAGLQTF